MHAFQMLVVALTFSAAHGLGQFDEYDRNDIWVKALQRCGKDGKEENITAAVKCQENTVANFESAEGKAGFVACDKEYCHCTGGTWDSTTNECAVPAKCKEDCSCFEQCYQAQMECAFVHTVHLYQSHRTTENWCAIAEITECVEETRPKMVEECKRGLAQTPAQISWMREPVPTGCDATLVCASSAVTSSLLLLAAAAVAAVLA